MKTIIKAAVFCLLSSWALAATAQNDGKGLVDRRVTLDDKMQTNGQTDVRQPVATPKVQPRKEVRPAMADTAVAVRLPDSDGSVKVSARLDTDTIIVGDQTTLHIILEGIGGKGVRMPSPDELCRQGIEALESANDTLRDANGKAVGIEQKVTVTSFDAGVQTIDGIVVSISDGKRLVRLSPADTLNLTVLYAADADTVKCEVKADVDYIAEPLTFWEVARWIVAALLLAMVVAAVVWIAKRRKEHKPIVVLPKAKPAPADQRALKELEALRRKELWQKGRIKKYYTDITDIVRRFLHNMYGISAAEMTTRQTLKAFHGIADWSEESEGLLRQLLQKADMVKFAKMQPEDYEHDLAMQNAVDFVRKVAETHKINNPEKEDVK